MEFKKNNRIMKRIIMITTKTFFLSVLWATAIHANSQNEIPLLAVYAENQHPVQNVRVSVTNTHQDKAIMLTSVEFDGQLPELRYFYHGIYGRIDKKGDIYSHLSMAQQLSMPVGSLFLLPGQSASWNRPLRIQKEGYSAQIQWMEIPMNLVHEKVWFQERSFSWSSSCMLQYRQLSKGKEGVYRSLSEGFQQTPFVVLEIGTARHSANIKVPCYSGFRFDMQDLTDYPTDSLRVPLPGIADRIIISKNKVFFFNYDIKTKKYTKVHVPIRNPTVIDFIYLCAQSRDASVPCILNPDIFSDIFQVKTPTINRYYDPGTTSIRMDQFSKLLTRAIKKEIELNVTRIDPNGLGCSHVLTAGVEIDDHGRQKSSLPQ